MTNLTPPPDGYREKTALTKAWVGSLVAGLTALATALTPDPGGATVLTPLEYVTVAIAVVATWGGVAATTNKAKE